jgi:hypothetical protein
MSPIFHSFQKQTGTGTWNLALRGEGEGKETHTLITSKYPSGSSCEIVGDYFEK